MDRQELLSALQELDHELNSSCEVVLVGGAAMILQFGAMRATGDIDFIILRGDIKELRHAILQVAAQENLPPDWMTDAVKGFADILPNDFAKRLTRLEIGSRKLRVSVLGRADQAAMKIVALRERDLEDLELLLPTMTNQDKQTLLTIMHHVATFRLDWAQKIQYFLEEQGWNIN